MKKEMRFFQGMAKLLRVMQERGVHVGHLMKPANHAEAADNLAAYLKTGCSEMGFVDHNMITFPITVDPQLTGMEAIEAAATNRIKTVNEFTVENMPPPTILRGYITFFYTGEQLSDDDYVAECEKRGLAVADPYTLAAFNAKHPLFADDHPNVTKWKGGDHGLHYLGFAKSRGERQVECTWYLLTLNYDLWYAGLSLLPPPNTNMG